MKYETCCICGRELSHLEYNHGKIIKVTDDGFDPHPIKESGKCCLLCEMNVVMQAELDTMDDDPAFKVQ